MKSTRRGSFSVHRSEKNPRFQRQLDKRPLSPGTSREASGVPCLKPRRGLTLLPPRGHAKTTRVSIRHNLWLMLHAKEPYILQVSDTYTQAASVIAALRFQVDNNVRLRKFF